MCPYCLCSVIQVSIRHSNTIQWSGKLLCIGYFQRERQEAASVGGVLTVQHAHGFSEEATMDMLAKNMVLALLFWLELNCWSSRCLDDIIWAVLKHVWKKYNVLKEKYIRKRIVTEDIFLFRGWSDGNHWCGPGLQRRYAQWVDGDGSLFWKKEAQLQLHNCQGVENTLSCVFFFSACVEWYFMQISIVELKKTTTTFNNVKNDNSPKAWSSSLYQCFFCKVCAMLLPLFSLDHWQWGTSLWMWPYAPNGGWQCGP